MSPRKFVRGTYRVVDGNRLGDGVAGTKTRFRNWRKRNGADLTYREAYRAWGGDA